MRTEPRYDFRLIYTYRNGTSFTEHYPKPLTLMQMASKVEKAREKYNQESNIATIEYNAKEVDTAE